MLSCGVNMKLLKRAAMALMLMVSTSAWATADKVVAVAQKASPDLMVKVGEYVNKVYEAALPIAKKAWEIGLLTLQVDAAGVFLFSFSMIGISLFIHFRLSRFIEECQAKADKYNGDVQEFIKNAGTRYYIDLKPKTWLEFQHVFDSAGVLLTRIVIWIPAVFGVWPMLNIWNWAKLFVPELWLAHAAIEKLMR